MEGLVGRLNIPNNPWSRTRAKASFLLLYFIYFILFIFKPLALYLSGREGGLGETCDDEVQVMWDDLGMMSHDLGMMR
jgi:hypothetical protein